MLAEPGNEFDHVYFPESGMLSLLAVLRDGKAIETATVGREEVVGVSAFPPRATKLQREVRFVPATYLTPLNRPGAQANQIASIEGPPEFREKP